ncbi:Carboxylesterase NlhH [compost metagenome]
MGQILAYPVTDYHTPATPSYLENAEGFSLTRNAMIRFWDDYLSSAEEGLNPLASPLRAQSLAGLPPALVMTAEFDPLRDEGDAYAERLAASGVDVRHLRYDGLIHGFLRMSLVSRRAREAFGDIGDWISALPS